MKSSLEMFITRAMSWKSAETRSVNSCGVDAGGAGGGFHLLAVLVRAGEEEHVMPLQPVPARQHVGGGGGIGMAQMRRAVHVIDRRGDVEGLFAHDLCNCVSATMTAARLSRLRPRTSRSILPNSCQSATSCRKIPALPGARGSPGAGGKAGAQQGEEQSRTCPPRPPCGRRYRQWPGRGRAAPGPSSASSTSSASAMPSSAAKVSAVPMLPSASSTRRARAAGPSSGA